MDNKVLKSIREKVIAKVLDSSGYYNLKYEPLFNEPLTVENLEKYNVTALSYDRDKTFEQNFPLAILTRNYGK